MLRRRSIACRRQGLASLCARAETSTPARASADTCSSVTLSGATVTLSAGSSVDAAISVSRSSCSHGTDECRIVRALASDREVRTFKVKPRDSRHSLLYSLDQWASIIARVFSAVSEN